VEGCFHFDLHNKAFHKYESVVRLFAHSLLESFIALLVKSDCFWRSNSKYVLLFDKAFEWFVKRCDRETHQLN